MEVEETEDGFVLFHNTPQEDVASMTVAGMGSDVCVSCLCPKINEI